MTKSFEELQSEGNHFIDFLKSQNYSSFIIKDSFRDYNVKIKFQEYDFILYHKPSKDSYSIGTHEINNNQIKDEIERLWYQYKFPNEQRNKDISAYVDGSFLNYKIGWGLIIVKDEKIIFENNGIVQLSEEEGSRQIGGEVQAVLEAIEYAYIHKIKGITIYYDYKGLEMWATGQWKAQSAIAQYYVGKLMQNQIKISWCKIKAHSGHIYNERADKLAKKAIL